MGRGRGRGRGGRYGHGGGGRGKRKPQLDKRMAKHVQMFGEQHPASELGVGVGDEMMKMSPRKRKKVDGGGGWSKEEPFSRKVEVEEEEESESDGEETPYNQLLSLFKRKKEVQVLSDEEEEESAEEEEEEASSEGEGGSDKDEEQAEEDRKPKLETKAEEVVEEAEAVDETVQEETVIEDAEFCSDMEADEGGGETRDPFLLHFEREMSTYLTSQVKDEKSFKFRMTGVWPEINKFEYHSLDWKEVNEQLRKDRDLHRVTIDLSSLGSLQPVLLPHPPSNAPIKDPTFDTFHIKSQLQATFQMVNQKVIDSEKKCRNGMSALQREVLEIASHYYNAYFPIRTFQNDEEIRNVYCLHVANHILKTRTRILHHNAKMVDRVDVPDAYRDQGFVRPKIVVLVPFKDTAYKVIKTLIAMLLPEQKGNVANKKRFEDEYSGSTIFLPKTNPKPDDYNATFGGNVEDNFKIGMSLTKKTVKLYTGFYSSDIIVASPLGLRMVIGAEGEKNRDFDFLASIELLVMDQADIFLMQNWDHLLHLIRHLHLQPLTTHGTDFARIRPWALDGLTKYFCQTLVFSSIFCPEHVSMMTKYFHNFAGQVRLVKHYSQGSINNVTIQIPQVFQYFEVSSLQKADDERFEFFIKTVLPNFTDALMSHTLIFVSSYFDFVRLRNHFKREQTSFVQICEYTKDKKIARARDYFFHGKGHFLLYTERVHYFRRLRLKGIGHILFYQLPQYPHFYSEICNFVQEEFQNRKVRIRKNASITVVYCKYDTPRLAAVIGTDRAGVMLSSEKQVHAFVSGEL